MNRPLRALAMGPQVAQLSEPVPKNAVCRIELKLVGHAGVFLDTALRSVTLLYSLAHLLERSDSFFLILEDLEQFQQPNHL
jgi:hypothetical protein